MHSSTCRGLCLAVWLTASPLAHTQSGPKAVKPDPLNPMAAVPATSYTSPLARYRAAGEIRVGSWQAANDNVTRIGGWRAYTREANQPEPGLPGSSPAATNTAPSAAPAASKPITGHGAHGKH